MEILWIQLIKLANINDGGRDGMQKNIPSDIMKCLNNLELVAVPTSTIPVLPSGNYKEAMIGKADWLELIFRNNIYFHNSLFTVL